jgi:hypothetical protein
MLYVRYVHLTKTKPIHKRERMLHKDCDIKGSVSRKKSVVVNLKGLGRIPAVVK